MMACCPAYRSSSVRRHWLFRATVLGLLAFFALAAVHELIPELCPILEGTDDECPFCTLLFMLRLPVAIVVCLLCQVAVETAPWCPRRLPRLRVPRSRYSPRAPPA